MVTKPAATAAAKPGKDPAKDDTGRRVLGPGSLAGNLTRDPELRYTPSGRAVASLRVACSDRHWSDKQEKWIDADATFHDVTVWGQLAEHCAEHLVKGQRIVAEGQWEAQSWTDTEDNIQEREVLVARDLGPSMLFHGARVIKSNRRPA